MLDDYIYPTIAKNLYTDIFIQPSSLQIHFIDCKLVYQRRPNHRIIKTNQKSVYEQFLDQMDLKVKDEIVSRAIKKLNNQQTAGDIVDELIEIMQLVSSVPDLEKIGNKHINEILTIALNKRFEYKITETLYNIILQNQNPDKAAICRQIQETIEYSCHISQNVIRQFTGVKNPVELSRHYVIFKKYYKEYKNRFINHSRREDMGAKLKQIVQLTKSEEKASSQMELPKETVDKVLAFLLVYMSLKKGGVKFYSDRESSGGAVNEILEAHAVQVMSILLFMRCDDEKSEILKISTEKGTYFSFKIMENHFMQVPSGQGKSIILGIFALLLVLLGNRAYCVCYSSELSSRDYKDFLGLFENFDVKDQINYGTFSEFQEMKINENRNIRDFTEQIFSKKQMVKQIIDQLS